MKAYRNLSGESGVRAYAIAGDAIKVEFEDGKVYTYSYAITGREKVERMKALARAGRGLCAYIAREVKGAYAERH